MYKVGVYCRQNKIQWSYVPYAIQLTGTPLDQTIMASIPIHNEFKKKYRLDIVNQIFLSDGASTSISVGTVEEYHSTGQKRPAPYYRSESLPSLVGYGKNYNIVKIIDPNKIINDAGNLTIRQNVAIRACRFSNTAYFALSRIAVTYCFT